MIASPRPTLLPELTAALARRPFAHLRLHLDGGAFFEVTRPELVTVTGSQILLSRRGAAGLIFDRVEFDPALITRIEVTSVTAPQPV